MTAVLINRSKSTSKSNAINRPSSEYLRMTANYTDTALLSESTVLSKQCFWNVYSLYTLDMLCVFCNDCDDS